MSKNKLILKLKAVAETLVNPNLFQIKIEECKGEIQILEIDEVLHEFDLNEQVSYKDFNFPKLAIDKEELKKTGYIDEYDYFIYLHTILSILISKKEESFEYLFDKSFNNEQYNWVQIHLLRALLEIGKNGIYTKIILDKIISQIDSFDSLVKSSVLDKLSKYPKNELIDNLFSVEIERDFEVFLRERQTWLWANIHSNFHRINKYDPSELEKYFPLMEDMCLGRFDKELEEFKKPEEEENEFEIFLYNLCKAIIGLMYFKINKSNLEVNEMLRIYMESGQDEDTCKKIRDEFNKFEMN